MTGCTYPNCYGNPDTGACHATCQVGDAISSAIIVALTARAEKAEAEVERLRALYISNTGDLDDDVSRLRAGLKLIISAGAVHGAPWCVSQARGYLYDLDFDQWPDTGKPPIINQQSVEGGK